MVGQGVSSNQLKFMDFSFMYFVQTAWINKIWISRMKNSNVVNFKMDVIVFQCEICHEVERYGKLVSSNLLCILCNRKFHTECLKVSLYFQRE